MSCRTAAVGGLRALAAAGRLGVLNTWGAKGVFHWQSRHHWATVGLQELDFELGGLGSADLVLVTGVDEREAPPRFWAQLPASDRAARRSGAPGRALARRRFLSRAPSAAPPPGRGDPGRLGCHRRAADALARDPALRPGAG